MDGSNGSTTFTDSSGLGHVVTNSPPVTVDTATVKFGTGSSFFTVGHALALDGSTDFSFGTADFTIDFWVNSSAGTCGFATTYQDGNVNNPAQWTLFQYGSQIFFRINVVSGVGDINSGSTLFPTTGWHHIAYVRSAGVVTIYLDGTAVGSGACTSNFVNGPNSPVIGPPALANSGIPGFSGNMDEFRILNGRAAWVANFTPPTTPYT
jgi:hypothetical protein